MATYLVTGGCGFIGSHLCAALVRRGDQVRVLDNLATGSLARLPPSAALIRGDVADPQRVHDALAGTDGCFHLAGIASFERCHRDWMGSHRTNLTGAFTVFTAAAAAGPMPVVYASSAAVYGDCPNLPLAEDAETRPLSAYAADKIGCELHARASSIHHRWQSRGKPADPSADQCGGLPHLLSTRRRRRLPAVDGASRACNGGADPDGELRNRASSGPGQVRRR
jgi:UDP-glucose 4-epimerase